MNAIRQFIRSRLQRGFGLQQLGPNEARVLFDAVIAVAASACSILFCLFLVPSLRLDGRQIAVLAALPVVFPIFNAVLGL